MATIRMTASAGAALIALMAIVPATSQAQAPGAPLQLVPGPSQAKPATRAALKAKAATSIAKAPGKVAGKTTRKTATRTTSRQKAAVVRPAPKALRANSRTAASSLARNRQQTGPHAPLARYAYPQPVIRAAVVPYLAVSRPVLRRGAQEPPVVARDHNADASEDRVMRGRDSVALVGMLPWWRNDRMQSVNYGSAEAESKVLEAAAVWLAANRRATEADNATRPASVEAAIEIADADEINDIDLAAGPVPAPPSPGFLQSLLALIGGAAAAAAASARLLFA